MTTLLSACGGTKQPVLENNPGAAAKQEPIELVIYTPYAYNKDDFSKTFSDPIKQKFPHIYIKFIAGEAQGTKLEELLTAGQKLDIVFHSSGANFSVWDYGLQYDITPLISKFSYDLSKLDPSMVDLQKKLANGGIYGLPVFVSPSTTVYNKDIFDKFGVAYPKDDMTWDDLYELAKKLTRNEGGIPYIGMDTSYSHFALLNQWSIPIVDTATKKATYDTDPRWKGFTENLARFFKVPGHELTGKYANNNDARNRFFKERTVAMWLNQVGLPSSKETENFNYDYAPYPVFKDKPKLGPQAYPTNFYITNQTLNKDQAFQVIAFLTSEEFQLQRAKEGLLLPTLTSKAIKESFGADNPQFKGRNVKALQPAEYAMAGSANSFNNMAKEEMFKAMLEINSGKIDINTALREAAERANKKIMEKEAAKK